MSNQKFNQYNVFQNENESNSMMTALANRLINVRSKGLQTILSDFDGSEHKLEFVKNIKGIDFINDSRSSNPNAVWYALETMTKPVTWITNIEKVENITDSLITSINNKVKKIVVQGVYKNEIVDFFSNINIESFFIMNLEDAVRTAFYASEDGDVVLFSPGSHCAGTYESYRERGYKFKDAVAQL